MCCKVMDNKDYTGVSGETLMTLFSGEVRTFSECDFSDVEFPSKMQFSNITFIKCDFSNAVLKSCEIEGVVFKDNCNLTDSDFRYSQLTDVVFDGCNGVNANFERSHMSSVSILGSKFLSANFNNVSGFDIEISETMLDYASLHCMDLCKRELKKIRFVDADLSGCDFRKSTFIECDLSGAEMRSVQMEGADLREANLGDIKFNDAVHSFQGAVISKKQAGNLLLQCGLIVI